MATVNGIASAELSKKLATPGAVLTSGELKGVLNTWQADFAAVLPAHLKNNAPKYARQALALFNNNPALQKCSGVSILNGLMAANALGLELSPQLGLAYLIPYAKNGRTEAQFQLGYRGALKLAYQSDLLSDLAVRSVYERDEFDYWLGLKPDIIHKPCKDGDPGPLVYVYAVADFQNGGHAFEIMSVEQVRAHAAKFSKSYLTSDRRSSQSSSSPWGTHFEAMAKKTVLLRLLKYLPMVTDLNLASAFENAPAPRDLSAVSDERDVITLAADEPDFTAEVVNEAAAKPDESEAA